MGLGLPDGGHLTHGYYTAKKKITASSIYFQSLPYRVDPSTGLLDYEQLETNSNLFKPRLLYAARNIITERTACAVVPLTPVIGITLDFERSRTVRALTS